MFSPSFSIPARYYRHYQVARAILYVIFIACSALFVLRTLFPTFVFSFNFRTFNSTQNSLLDPHGRDNSPRVNGKIDKNDALVLTAGGTREFSRANIQLTLENKPTAPADVEVALRRSYRAFLLPTSQPITTFPKESLYRVNGIYFALREGTLYQFVSDNAYLSRYPDTFAIPEDTAFLAKYPKSENWIGYRVGSLLAFADGAFLVTSETEMRPIGSPEIFLSLGYRFEDVRPASEEEIGIYKRGKIILRGIQHPDGTLFLDQDTGTYYLIENNSKHPLLDPDYRDFILRQQAPIAVSSEASKVQVSCVLRPGFFGQSFSCQTPLTTLHSGSGNDYEITLENRSTGINVNTLQVSFATEKSKQNMLYVLSRIKQLLLIRFGLNQ